MYKRIQRQNITCIIYWKCNCNRNTFLRISDRFEHFGGRTWSSGNVTRWFVTWDLNYANQLETAYLLIMLKSFDNFDTQQEH